MTETNATAASTVPPPKRSAWRPDVRWFAAEIVVVVAGVLIALALNAWWGARQETREEQRLLAALLGEFTANQERLADLVAFHEDLKTTTQALLALSVESSDASVAADSVDQLLADATWWSSYTTLESTVLDAAMQDGQLDLIQTDSLRRLLSTWRSQVGAATAQSGQEFAHYSEVWLPLLRTGGELGQISNRATVIPGTDTPYQGESVPLPPQRADHRRLVQSRALRNALVQKLWIENDVLYQYERLGVLLDRVLRALERELEDAHVGEG